MLGWLRSPPKFSPAAEVTEWKTAWIIGCGAFGCGGGRGSGSLSIIRLYYKSSRRETIPHVQGQEQRLRFAGPAVWR